MLTEPVLTETVPTEGLTRLRIGPIEIDRPVVLAPMAGVTNPPFRSLCRRFGAGLYVGEMVGARSLVEGHATTLRLASFGADESPRSIQLYGTNATDIDGAVRDLVNRAGADHIDLNFGCPAPKVTRNGGGAALPVRRRLLTDIISAAVRAAGDVPVTAKFRMGVDDDHLTYLETGRIAADVGCAAIALHARTAEQLYSGTARWAAIAELKAAVDGIPVLGNGDIWDADDALAMMAQTGCDGVVIGRGCLGRPWLFGHLAAAFAGQDAPPLPSLGDVGAMMVEHFDLLEDWAGTHLAVREFRKHAGWYLKGFPVGGELKGDLNQLADRAHLVDRLGRLDPAMTMTPEGRRSKRGHQGGPRPVALPHGWYDLADSDEALADAAAVASSGG